MPKRRRRRRPFNWGPFLWLALLANIAAGLWFSPLTSVRRLRIEGAPLSDRGRLVTLAQTLKNQPALSIDPRAFETFVQKESKVERAEFKRSLFGSAGLTIQYRKAIARIEPMKGLYLDALGSEFTTNDPPKNLPVLVLHPSALKPTFTLLGSSPLQEIAKLIQRIPKNLYEKGVKVEVDSEGSVCLNITQGARIDLGAADRLEEKLKALEKLLAERPKLLQDVQVLNLTEPSRPAVQPRRA